MPGKVEAMDTIQVVLADDHAVLRDGLILLLNEFPGIKVVGSAANGFEATRKCWKLSRRTPSAEQGINARPLLPLTYFRYASIYAKVVIRYVIGLAGTHRLRYDGVASEGALHRYRSSAMRPNIPCVGRVFVSS